MAYVWRIVKFVLCLAVVGLFAYAVWDAVQPVAKVRAVAAVLWCDELVSHGGATPTPLPQSAPGTVVSAREPVEIRSSVDGTVAEIMVKKGDTVRRGQLLLRLDDSFWQNALARYDGEQSLAATRDGAATLPDTDGVSSRIASLLRSMCSRCNIISPVDGVVETIGVTPGESVRASSVSGLPENPPLLVLQPAESIAMQVPLTPRQALRVGLRRAATISFEGQNEPCHGVVASLRGVLDQGSDHYDVRVILFDNSASVVLGMKGLVQFCEDETDRELRSTVLIPREALLHEDGDNAEFWVIGVDNLLKKCKAPRRPHRDEAARVAVMGGVKPGEPVVISPDPSLYEGQRVTTE